MVSSRRGRSTCLRLQAALLLGCWAAFWVASAAVPGRSAAQAKADREAPSGDPPAAGEAPKRELGPIVVQTVSAEESITLPDVSDLSLGIQAGAAATLRLGARTIPLENLISLRFSGEAPAGAIPGEPPSRIRVRVFLRGGGELLGEIAAANEAPTKKEESPGESFAFNCPVLSPSPLRLGIDSIKGLIVVAAAARAPTPGAHKRILASEAEARLGREILQARPTKDEVVLPAEGRVEGVLESIDPGGVKFSSESLGEVRIGFDKLRALVLAEIEAAPRETGTERDARAPRTRLFFRDGSWAPARITGIEAGKVQAAHPELGSLQVPFEALSEVAFLSGRVSYLSDREAARVEERLGPSFVLEKPYRRDLNVLGEPLRMRGREYRKGLGVHSYSLLEYDLGGEFTRFQSVVGLDDSAKPPDGGTGSEGTVVFRARLDGKQLFEKAMTWRDLPASIDLPVDGGKRLALEVDYGGPADLRGVANSALDRADWAEARLVR